MTKTLNYLITAAIGLSTLLASCKPEPNENNKKEVPAPSMLSFKFELSRNPEAISADAIGEIKGQEVSVNLPKTADLTRLVATFEVGEGDVVKLGDVVQESGVTANDFSQAKDYIVTNSDGSKNAIYSVKINRVNGEWKLAGTYSEIPVKASTMKVNPVDGMPYVLLNEREIKENITPTAEMLSLVKFNGESFELVGGKGFSGKVGSSELDLGFDKAGTPYVAYQLVNDAAKSTAAMKYNGSEWQNMYTGLIGDMIPKNLSLAVAADNNVVVTYINDYAKSATFKKNEIVASLFNGSDWANENPLGKERLVVLTANCAAGGSVYVSAVNRQKSGGKNYSHEVLEYKAGAWASLRKDYVREEATQTGIFVLDIDASASGDVYLLTADDAEKNKEYHFRVEKYSASTKEWTAVGTPLSYIHNDSHDEADIALTPDGTPYVTYYSFKSPAVYVTYFDKDTKQWSEPFEIAKEKVSDIALSFSKAGTGYLAYKDEKGVEKLYIYK